VASITDCVVEGLKYPFNDIKKLLCFGVLFAIFDLLSLAFSLKSFDIFRMLVHITENADAHLSSLQFSQLPVTDIYIAAAILIAGFIVSLFVMGYQYNVVRFSIDKKQDLPGFADILGMFIKGIKYFLVVLAYNIIPILVMAIGLIFVGNSSVLLVFFLIAGILFIVAFFLMIMALNNMIAHDDIRKAFDFEEITGNISNLGWGKYVGTVIFTLIVFMIINAAASFILSILTVVFAAAVNNQAIVVSIFITIIESLFISSYCGVFYSRVCGSIYRESIK
jgi:hypothetical protein